MNKGKRLEDVIVRALLEVGRPMNAKDIARIILSRQWYETQGKTFDATVAARICMSIVREKTGSPFVRAAPGFFALRPGFTYDNSSEPIPVTESLWRVTMRFTTTGIAEVMARDKEDAKARAERKFPNVEDLLEDKSAYGVVRLGPHTTTAWVQGNTIGAFNATCGRTVGAP